MSMQGNRLRIGIVGAGGIVRDRHLPGLSALDDVAVVAVSNRSVESARAVAAEYGIAQVHDRWEDLVDADDIDAVIIGTPPNLHETVTVRALDRGKHVFCQARMAMDHASAQRMAQADRASTLTTMICPAPHYLDVDDHVRRLVSDWTVGDVRHVVVNHTSAMFTDPDQPVHWRQRHDVNGINVLEVGIVVEFLQRWFGDVDQVSSIPRTWTPTRPADRDGRTTVDNPDAVTIAGTFVGGATLTALFSGAAGAGRSGITVHGSAATLVVRPGSPHVELTTADGSTTAYDVPDDERRAWTVERDFVDAVRRGVKGNPSFEEGLRYMAVSEAVHRSGSTGGVVSVAAISAEQA